MYVPLETKVLSTCQCKMTEIMVEIENRERKQAFVMARSMWREDMQNMSIGLQEKQIGELQFQYVAVHDPRCHHIADLQ